MLGEMRKAGPLILACKLNGPSWPGTPPWAALPYWMKIAVSEATSKGAQTVPRGFHGRVGSYFSTSSFPVGEDGAHSPPHPRVPFSTR